MTVRAKLKIIKVAHLEYGGQEITFSTVYDNAIPEDLRFQKATPWGQFTMTVDNPLALEKLKLGQSYYVDFNPVPAAAPTAQPVTA